MAKQTQKQANEKEGKKMQAFLDEYDVKVQELIKTYGKRMIPILQASERGLLPVFGVENVVTPVSNEKGNKSEDEQSGDSNDKDSEGEGS